MYLSHRYGLKKQGRVCQQDGQIEGPLFMSAQSKNNLVSVFGQKYLCGSFGIQVRYCETIIKSKTKDAHFETGGCTKKADSPVMIPVMDLKAAPYPCRVG